MSRAQTGSRSFSAKEVRTAAKSVFDGVRITRNGEVHVKGFIPGTNEYGWFLLGFLGTMNVEGALWYEDGSIRPYRGGAA
jgi:hypothetical protein